jgi:hypothetical protein
MAVNEIRSTTIFSQPVSFTSTVTLPDSTITSAKIQSGTIAADRMRDVRRSQSVELFGPAVSVAAVTKWLHIVRGGTGALVGFEAAIAVPADDASRTITVDLHKSTGAAAFATVLSATIGFTNGSVARTATAATINTTALTDGDILEVVVTVAGGAGNQATGLTVTLTFDEYNT